MDAFITRKRPRSVEAREPLRTIQETSISPPPKRNIPKDNGSSMAEAIDLTGDDEEKQSNIIGATDGQQTFIKPKTLSTDETTSNVIPSPIQLNHIQGLPPSSNIDTVKLCDILGDPMIKECWLFNYLFDIDFIMQQSDPDTRHTVRIRVVHGSWKAEDMNGIGIIDGARRYPNIEVVKAYMAEVFGTHHSKMIVLFRHDDLAQVIILTANFIERDWIMSQASWGTPLLPFLTEETYPRSSLPPLGSGLRFKHDLVAYLRGYGSGKLNSLITQLQQYDFSTVRGALIASIPGRQILQSLDPETETLWGWPALKSILSRIPSPETTSSTTSPQPQIIVQISSVASVGENWLTNTFFPAFSTSPKTPKISIIFPTADTIRRSITGYAAGASIHMKTSTPAQAKQLSFIHPLLHHWSPPSTTLPPKSTFFTSANANPSRNAGRHRAAPHIKTYIRFSSPDMESIDWAILSSANLSTQAWGGASVGGEVRICSFEIGVCVWPEIFAEEGGKVRMVPVFGGDYPRANGQAKDERDRREQRKGELDEENQKLPEQQSAEEDEEKVVGWRMPYDLPLFPYAKDEKPWCASEPDGEKVFCPSRES